LGQRRVVSSAAAEVAAKQSLPLGAPPWETFGGDKPGLGRIPPATGWGLPLESRV